MFEALTVRLTSCFTLLRILSIMSSQNCDTAISSSSISLLSLFSSSDSVWMWLENSSRAFTSGCLLSSFWKVGSSWADMLLMNLAFRALLSLARRMVFFCLRSRRMKRISTTAPMTRAAARAAARMQRPMIIIQRVDSELSLSAMVASLSAICFFRAPISSACFRASVESFQAM